jgi:hypothetical protein
VVRCSLVPHARSGIRSRSGLVEPTAVALAVQNERRVKTRYEDTFSLTTRDEPPGCIDTP